MTAAGCDPHDPAVHAELGRRDPRVAAALARHGVPAPRRRPAGFGTLARIIVGQQVSARAAATIWGRVEAAAGGAVSAEAILGLDDEALRRAGLSRQKRRYLRALAEAVATGRLDPAALEALPDEEVIAALTALPGFGVWSAQMYLIFALARPDVWPVADLGVRSGLRLILGLAARPEPRKAEALGAPFRPLRSALALLAWHVLHNEPA